MWLTTRHGFFSVVLHNTDYHIRARRRSHLETLVQMLFGPEQDHRIITTPNADYRYRIIVNAVGWRSMMDVLARDVKYDNFKDSVPEDVIPHCMLEQVWSKMYELQIFEPRDYDDDLAIDVECD